MWSIKLLNVTKEKRWKMESYLTDDIKIVGTYLGISMPETTTIF